MRRYIIERYIAREALLNFLAVISVLLLIYVSNRFIRFLAEAAAGDIDSRVILELLVLKLTANSVLLLPLALYVGVLLALGRLYRDSEVVAMHAGGIGFARLLRSIGGLALVFAGLTAVLSLYVAPAAAERADSLTNEARSDSEMTGLYPGRFKEFSDGDQIIYAEDVAVGQNRMETVFVQVRRENALDLVFARTAHQFVDGTTGDRFMVLESGYRYEGNPGAPNFVIHEFKTHGVRIRKRETSEEYRPLEVLSLQELLANDTYTHLAELQWRLSVPISAFVLALLAVPLSRTSSREGKYGKLFIAVLVYFIYTNLMSISQKAVERGELTPLIGVWPVHLLMLGVVFVMVFIASGGWGRLRMRMRPRPRRGARTY